MNKETAVKELVDAHTRIKDEEMLTAIWIREAETPIWLVELLPGFADDDKADEPTVLSASKHGFDLYLVAGNEKSLRQGIKKNVGLAKAVVHGRVVHGNDKGRELQQFAADCVAQSAQVGRV
jgi:hypothetical protein